MSFDVIWSFIVENYRWLSSLLLSIVGFIIAIICKKRPSVIPEGWNSFLLSILPSLISEAETKIGSGHGSHKLSYVVYAAKKRLYERFPELFIPELDSIIKNAAESILATPEKKGV